MEQTVMSGTAAKSTPGDAWFPWLRRLAFLILLVALYVISLENYLLFHSLAEFFSITIAYGLFFVAWNTRVSMADKRFVSLGIAYLFIGILDLFHIMGFHGMQVFISVDYTGNQLWIAARSLESLTLLFFVLFARRIQTGRYWPVWTVYTTVIGLVLASVYIWPVFPACFIEGVGQTPFKIIAEYVIIAILFLTLVSIYRGRSSFPGRISTYLMISVGLTMAGELSFTLYSDNYGLLNLVGHYLKILSFWYINKAVIIEGLTIPLTDFLIDLTDKNERLEQSEATQKRIHSIIGHDLRNSVFGIRDVAALLQNDAVLADKEESARLLSVIRSGAEKAGRTLESLLDWSRSQSDMLEVSTDVFPVSTVVDDVLDGLQAAATVKGVTLRRTGDAKIIAQADQRMFQTVLRNLVGNAMKFSDRGDIVDIRWERRDNRLVLEVEDEGVGMPADVVAGILDSRPSRSRKGTAGEEGTGLGLDIVRSFLAFNDGRLDVESEEGRGSVFRTEWNVADLD